MELSVGMYVRTLKGIVKIDEIKDGVMKDTKGYLHYGDFIKVSHNIIDLIEVGDYVNGCQVLNVLNFNDNTRMLSLEKIYDSNIEEEDIKSIVTKEMFSSVEYRVETN